MEEKVFVGYNFGQFQNDEGRMQDYCNVFMLEDFGGQESNDYHFAGQKAVKYGCVSPDVFAPPANRGALPTKTPKRGAFCGW